MRRLALAVATLLALAGAPTAAWSQAGYYLYPSLGVTEEFNDNVFGTGSNPKSDFITRFTLGIAGGYQSVPLTLLGRYSAGAELYVDNSDLNGLNQQSAGLDFRYLPTQRLTLTLGAAFTRSESTPARLFQPVGPPDQGPPPAGGATPAPTPAAPAPTTGPGAPPVIPTVNTGRQPTIAGSATASASYVFTPALTGDLGYSFATSDVEAGTKNSSHEPRLSASYQVTPLDRGSLTYRFRAFESDAEKSSTSHVVTLGYGRRLTEVTDVFLELGPRFESEGGTNLEANARLTTRFQQVSLSLVYARTQGIVTGGTGAQDVDTVTGTATYTPLQRLFLSLGGSFQRTIDEQRGASSGSSDGSAASATGSVSRETRVYTVSAGASYRLTEWMSARASYQFSLQEGAPDIRYHIVSVSVDFTYPIRLY